MTSHTKKDASTHQNISEVKPLTPEEVDEMLLHDDTYESDKVLMKCDRCGCEMELDGYILSEIAEADGDGISDRSRSSEPDKIIDVYQQGNDGGIDDRHYCFLGYLLEGVFGIQ